MSDRLADYVADVAPRYGHKYTLIDEEIQKIIETDSKVVTIALKEKLIV